MTAIAVQETKVPCLTTVGALKKALEHFPDDMLLALDNRGIGWGFKPPYVAAYFKHFNEFYAGYLKADDPRLKDPTFRADKLKQTVCVFQPGTEHF